MVACLADATPPQLSGGFSAFAPAVGTCGTCSAPVVGASALRGACVGGRLPHAATSGAQDACRECRAPRGGVRLVVHIFKRGGDGPVGTVACTEPGCTYACRSRGELAPHLLYAGAAGIWDMHLGMWARPRSSLCEATVPRATAQDAQRREAVGVQVRRVQGRVRARVRGGACVRCAAAQCGRCRAGRTSTRTSAFIRRTSGSSAHTRTAGRPSCTRRRGTITNTPMRG